MFEQHLCIIHENLTGGDGYHASVCVQMLRKLGVGTLDAATVVYLHIVPTLRRAGPSLCEDRLLAYWVYIYAFWRDFGSQSERERAKLLKVLRPCAVLPTQGGGAPAHASTLHFSSVFEPGVKLCCAPEPEAGAQATTDNAGQAARKKSSAVVCPHSWRGRLLHEGLLSAYRDANETTAKGARRAEELQCWRTLLRALGVREFVQLEEHTPKLGPQDLVVLAEEDSTWRKALASPHMMRHCLVPVPPRVMLRDYLSTELVQLLDTATRGARVVGLSLRGSRTMVKTLSAIAAALDMRWEQDYAHVEWAQLYHEGEKPPTAVDVAPTGLMTPSQVHTAEAKPRVRTALLRMLRARPWLPADELAGYDPALLPSGFRREDWTSLGDVLGNVDSLWVPGELFLKTEKNRQLCHVHVPYLKQELTKRFRNALGVRDTVDLGTMLGLLRSWASGGLFVTSVQHMHNVYDYLFDVLLRDGQPQHASAIFEFFRDEPAIWLPDVVAGAAGTYSIKQINDDKEGRFYHVGQCAMHDPTFQADGANKPTRIISKYYTGSSRTMDRFHFFSRKLCETCKLGFGRRGMERCELCQDSGISAGQPLALIRNLPDFNNYRDVLNEICATAKPSLAALDRLIRVLWLVSDVLPTASPKERENWALQLRADRVLPTSDGAWVSRAECDLYIPDADGSLAAMYMQTDDDVCASPFEKTVDEAVLAVVRAHRMGALGPDIVATATASLNLEGEGGGHSHSHDQEAVSGAVNVRLHVLVAKRQLRREGELYALDAGAHATGPRFLDFREPGSTEPARLQDGRGVLETLAPLLQLLAVPRVVERVERRVVTSMVFFGTPIVPKIAQVVRWVQKSG